MPLKYLPILLTSLLCSCVVVPKQVTRYDEGCKVSSKKIELTLEELSLFEDIDCLDDCTFELMTHTLVLTTSAVVSGSVAVVGNSLYWLEREGECPVQAEVREQPEQIKVTKPVREEIIEVVTTAGS